MFSNTIFNTSNRNCNLNYILNGRKNEQITLCHVSGHSQLIPDCIPPNLCHSCNTGIPETAGKPSLVRLTVENCGLWLFVQLKFRLVREVQSIANVPGSSMLRVWPAERVWTVGRMRVTPHKLAVWFSVHRLCICPTMCAIILRHVMSQYVDIRVSKRTGAHGQTASSTPESVSMLLMHRMRTSKQYSSTTPLYIQGIENALLS